MNRVNSRNALSMMPESTIHIILVILLLADRTNGRAYATVSRPSVCRLCVCLCVCLYVTYVLWLNGASYRKTVWRSK